MPPSLLKGCILTKVYVTKALLWLQIFLIPSQFPFFSISLTSWLPSKAAGEKAEENESQPINTSFSINSKMFVFTRPSPGGPSASYNIISQSPHLTYLLAPRLSLLSSPMPNFNRPDKCKLYINAKY